MRTSRTIRAEAFCPGGRKVLGGKSENMEAFFKTSADLFKNAGYEVEIENLPSSACYDPDSLVGETDTLTLMVVSSAHENIIGYQQLYVQCSIILHGQKGRHFSQQTTISNLWGLSYSPVNAAAEVMESNHRPS